MAKCELSITLDEPDRRFHAGDLISGTLKVRVDQDVQCNGLEVGTSWRTHGRGNVDSATIDSQTVFSGDWRAGQLLEYPFKVKAAGWPPTYRGHHINVDHYVDARAKIPWAFDPKASEVIDVVASETSESPSNDTTTNKIVGGCVAAFIFAILIFVGMAVVGAIFQNALAIGIVGTTGASIAGFMIIRRLMIRWILGTPHCEFESLVIVQGDSINATISVTPRRNCTLNSLSMHLTAKESATSGSGTNKTTHRHTVFERRVEAESGPRLEAGQTRHFKIACPLPEDAAPSFDLGDNELNWLALIRIDIPRWPDWTHQQKFVVASSDAVKPAKAPTTIVTPTIETITFSETIQHLWSVRDDVESREQLLEATLGMTFDIEAIIERRLLYSGDNSPNVYANGHAVWARFPNPNLPLVLYVPQDWGDEFEHIGQQVWKGRGTVVGWDRNDGRLQLKIEDI